MRDIALTLFVGALLPAVLLHPIIGVYLWAWLGLMNPHRLTWSFAYALPLSFMVAIATLIGLLVTRDARRIPWSPPIVVLVLMLAWISIGYFFWIYPAGGLEIWQKFLKVQLLNFIALALICRREQIDRLIWVIVISLGFYGVKGGLFTILGGGEQRVWGPGGTFIAGNNEIGLALIMTIPLMRYLSIIVRRRWARWALFSAMLLTGLAALGTQSRGALVAGGAMVAALWWRSHHKVAMGLGILAIVPWAIAFMPGTWDERMLTILNYEKDNSATGRINAWKTLWNLALDRPLFGGGPDIYSVSVFAAYSPEPERIHAAHSIYFQMLGEHGFVAMGLFMLLGILTWRTGTWIRRTTRDDRQNYWAFHVASMCQVSLIGYAVGGAFLSLAYFDLPYFIVVIMLATKWVIQTQPDPLVNTPKSANREAASGNPREGVSVA